MSAKEHRGGQEFHEFVPLLFARNLVEAEFFKSLLEDHDIVVLIEDENTESMGLPDPARGVPVLVPEDQLSEAEDIIERRSEMDDELEEQFDDFEDEDDDEDEEELEGFEEFEPEDEFSDVEEDEEYP